MGKITARRLVRRVPFMGVSMLLTPPDASYTMSLLPSYEGGVCFRSIFWTFQKEGENKYFDN
jgi:hypothetical protein